MFKKIKRKVIVACAMALPIFGFAQLGVQEYILMRPDGVNKQVGAAWSYIPYNDFSNYFFENFFINLADEGHSTDDGEALLIKDLYQNNVSKEHRFNWDNRDQGRWDGNYWARYQEMIILINSLINDINTSGSELATAVGSNSKATVDELRVLRAFYYLQATRLYGAFPIWEKYSIDYLKGPQIFINDYPLNNVTPVFHSDLRRNPAAEVFRYVVLECQSAIANGLLPWHQTGDKNRMTLAIACAVMSQASLYAASPLYNNGENLWQWAYQTNRQAFDLLTANGYELYSNLADSRAYLNAYQEYFALNSHDGNTPADKETIWGSPAMYRAEGLYVVNGMPIVPGMFKVGSCPTQELIDAYDMLETGRPIYDLTNPYADEQHLNVNYNTASGYDPKNPYVGRDPRFYANTTYDGCKITPSALPKTVRTFNNTNPKFFGADGNKGNCAIDAGSRLATRTGYYNRKFHQFKENSSTKYSGGNWKLFRLGEVYLNYAEAAIEAGEINKGLELINAVRHRAGFAPQVDVTADNQDYARLLVRHERQVELAFEGQRYYDVRRWKTTGTEVKEEKYKTGMWITTDGGKPTYHRFVIDPYKTGVTSEYSAAQNLLVPPSVKTIIELSEASGTDKAYWQNPGHEVPGPLKFKILSEGDKTCELTGYNFIDSEDGSLIIPSTTEIAGKTYTVTSIRSGALSNCEKITSVEIPATVNSIDGNPFPACTRLTKIIVSDENPAFCSVNGVLFNKDKTTLLIFPSGKEGGYTIPSSVTDISNSAFAACINLFSVNIPNSVTSIGDGAFSGCSLLLSVEIPNSVTSISDGTFFNCISLTSVSILGSITSIGNSAFANCVGLTSFDIPNSVTSISDNAFGNCNNLTSISIPGSVESIGLGAFAYCTGLTSVYYNSENPIEGRADMFISLPDVAGPYDNAVLYVPAAAVEKCKMIDPWKNFKNIQEYGFSGIDNIAADIDSNYPCEIYNLNGIKTATDINALAPGIYILRQGSKVRKIAVK